MLGIIPSYRMRIWKKCPDEDNTVKYNVFVQISDTYEKHGVKIYIWKIYIWNYISKITL